MSANANDLPEVSGSEKADATTIQGEFREGSTEPAKGAAKLGLPNELNKRINRVDAELTELRGDLTQANKSVKSGLRKLDDKHVDLSTQISDAFKQLGALDERYRALTDKSARINEEIRAVTADVGELRASTGSELAGLAEQHQALVARTEEVAEKSRLAVQALNRGIRDNGKALGELKEQLTRDIDNLSRTSREQGEALGEDLVQTKGRLAQTQEQINKAQARMLKMQAVDQALERRAAALEEVAERLLEQTGELAGSTKALKRTSDELAAAIEELRARAEAQARELEAQAALLVAQGERILFHGAQLATHEEQLVAHTEQIEAVSAQSAEQSGRLEDHTGRIGGLEQAQTETRASLASLAEQEERRFRGMGVAAAVLLLISGGIYYQQTQDQARQAADLAIATNQLETQGVAAKAATTLFEQRTDALEVGVAAARQASLQGDDVLRQQVVIENKALREELESLNSQLVTLNDQVDSIGGRVATLHSGVSENGDGVVHGPRWLAERPAGDYVVHLATLDDKSALYRLAEQYGGRLKGELSYVPFTNGGDTNFALILGSYSTRNEADAAQAEAPRSLEGQKPQVYPLAVIRPYLGG